MEHSLKQETDSGSTMRYQSNDPTQHEWMLYEGTTSQRLIQAAKLFQKSDGKVDMVKHNTMVRMVAVEINIKNWYMSA